MAIYHYSESFISKSKGHSAIAAAAYQMALKLENEVTGKIEDYSRKKGVIYSEIFVPENSPLWLQEIAKLQKRDPAKAAEQLWNSIEKHETRINAQYCRTANFALPVELNKTQCEDLVKDYVQRAYIQYGMIASCSIHFDSEGNPHAHVMASLRDLTSNGWGKKNRSWNQKEILVARRAILAEVTNSHLKMAGFDKTISHLSYAERGINQEPTVHVGNKRNNNEQARKRNQEIRKRNLLKIIDNPEAVLEKLSQESSSFSIEDIAKALSTQLEPANQEIDGPTPTPPNSVKQNLGSRVSGFLNAVAPKLFQQPSSVIQTTVAQAPLEAVPTPSVDIPSNAIPEQVVGQVLVKITQHESVFTEKQLAYVLGLHLKNPESVAQALIEIKNSSQLMAIGLGEDGRERYTTRDMFEIESYLQDLADELNENTTHKVQGHIINKYIKQFGLEDDQAKAVRHVLKGNDITAIVGRAGTGKSYSLQVVRAALEGSGYRVQGVTLSGIASNNLENEAGIKSRTIESFSKAIASGKLVLSQKDVIVMDEAGITDSLSMFKIMVAVKRACAKLVLVGDDAQLQSIGPGAVFRALLERIGLAKITTIRRQKETWQREATAHFAAGNTKKALEYYEQHGNIHLTVNSTVAMNHIIDDWFNAVKSGNLEENLILAYENKDIEKLNSLAREKLVYQVVLRKSHISKNYKGELELAIGERLLFLENNWRYRVKNGQRGTISNFEITKEGKISAIHVRLDGKQESIVFSPKDYNKFDYGYACTVHRSQGVTVKNAFVFAVGNWIKNLTYVAMSRHKAFANLYAGKDNYETIDKLKKALAKAALKDSVLDYPLAFAKRRGIETDTIGNIARLQKHLREKLQWMGESLKNNFEQTFFPGRYWEKKEKMAAEKQTLEETLQRREDAKKVAAYVDANKAVGIAFEALRARKHVIEIQDEADAKKVATALGNHPSLNNFKAAIKTRDALAYQIYQAHGKYTQALHIYDISLEKLARESKRHQMCLNLAQYLKECTQERMIHRDKLAAIIQNEITAYYPILMDEKVNLSLLRAHARAHYKRDILRKQTCAEREEFREVEHYSKLCSDGTKLWQKIFEKENALKSHLLSVEDLKPYQLLRLQTLAKTGEPVLREMLIKAQKINQERDAMAATIFYNLSRYETGLKFYQVGECIGQGAKAKEWAKQRFERLSAQAIRHNQKLQNRSIINEYLATPKPLRRAEIAAQIISNKKQFYSIIFEVCPDPMETLRSLHKDAKTCERLKLIEGLNGEELEAFVKVENFVQARRTVGQIRTETKGFDIAHLEIKRVILPHLELRDTLAFEVFNHPERYEKSLAFFNIKIEHLDKNAFYHQIRNYCAEFKKQAGNFQARLELAKKITSNRSAYAVVKESIHLNWHQLQNYADYAIKQECIAALSPQEKQDYQTILKYKRLRREAGVAWSEIFNQKKESIEVADNLFEKAISLNSERNQLAFAIKENRIHFDEFLFSGQVQTKDIEKHAKTYEKQLKREQQYNALVRAHKSVTKASNINQKTANTTNVQLHKIPKPYWDVESIINTISYRADAFVRDILGPPLSRTSNATTYRYGRKKGSLHVTVRGNKAGLWYDFATCEGGNLLALLERERNLEFKEALQYAAEWAGIAPESDIIKKQSKLKVEQQLYLKSNGFTKKQLEKIAYAKEIVQSSVPIAGTLAERYLKEHRGVDARIINDNFRFHPSVNESITTKKNWPALVVVAKNSQGEVQSIQCIYLDPQTAKKIGSDTPKLTFGPQSGACVLAQTPKNVPGVGYQYALSEGPETALSIAQANRDLGVFVSLGISNFANVPIPTNAKSILLCADNDGINTSSEKSLNKAISALAERGLDVYVIKPTDCKDFNDVLLKQGESEVKKLIDKKNLVRKAFTLEQLVADKEILTSDKAKIVAEFSIGYQVYDKIKSLTSVEEIKTKQQALEYSGKIAAFIKQDPLLMEIANRFKIDSDITVADKEYTKQKALIAQVKAICTEIPSKDFIADYLELKEQIKKLTPPWVSQDKAEVSHWRSLNTKIEKLAFVIENTPELKHTAKTFPNYNSISADAHSHQKSINKNLQRSQDIDMETGY